MRFGSDLLVLDGAIVYNGDDLVIVEGIENVKQQAYLRSITDLGESIFYSNYGGKIYEYLAKPYTPENIEKVENEAKEILLSVGSEYGAPWISEVLECKYILIEIEGKTVKLIYTKYVVNGEITESNFNIGGD